MNTSRQRKEPGRPAQAHWAGRPSPFLGRFDLPFDLGLGRLAQWAQAGRPTPFRDRLGLIFGVQTPRIFQSFCPSRLHPFRRRYLRDFFEEKDRMKNPSLNISLLCLAPKYLDLILWGLSFGLHWRVDVHECASNQHGLWPSSFSMLALDHGPRHFMLQNRPKTCKNEVPPKYMCICENDQ